MAAEKIETFFGVLLPESWTAEGEVLTYKISMSDERDLLIVSGLNGELDQFLLRKPVEVKGVVETREDLKEYLSIKQITQIKWECLNEKKSKRANYYRYRF